jgi:hypothetical protein
MFENNFLTICLTFAASGIGSSIVLRGTPWPAQKRTAILVGTIVGLCATLGIAATSRSLPLPFGSVGETVVFGAIASIAAPFITMYEKSLRATAQERAPDDRLPAARLISLDWSQISFFHRFQWVWLIALAAPPIGIPLLWVGDVYFRSRSGKVYRVERMMKVVATVAPLYIAYVEVSRFLHS